MDAVSLLIEWLKEKRQLTQLEADFLETFKELSKVPFDRFSASMRMGLNYRKYQEILFETKCVLGVNAQPDYTLSNDEIRNNLQWQLLKLAEKEQEALRHGQQT